jgi:trigger factor
LKEEGIDRMKKIMYLFMGLCILILIGGCSKKDLGSNVDTTDKGTETDTETDGDTTDDTAVEIPKIEDFDASEYVTLGQYKGIEVTVEPIEVTDEDITTAINEDLKANATVNEITDRAVQEGDTVNIDFEGLLDGVAFEGGTAEAYDLTIGSGAFVPGFEEGLIGLKTGDKKAVDVTFPEDYSEELAGKAVVFNVTINSISESVLPELNEQYVVDNTDYETITAYKDAVRKELETSNAEEMENQKAQSIMEALIEGATVSSLPETLLNYNTAYFNYQIGQEAAMYGMDIATYISQYGMTQEDFDAYVKSLSEASSKRDLVLTAVAQTEKMEATDEDYQAELPNYLSGYQVESEEELLKLVTKEEIERAIVMQKSYNFVIDNAVVK